MFRFCWLNILILSAGLEFHGSPFLDVQAGINGGEKPPDLLQVQRYMLHNFVQDFRRDYVPGTHEWIKRETIFQTNLKKVMNLLSKPSLSWTPGITNFMDYTEHEYSQLLGYRGRRSRASMAPVSPGRRVANLLSTHLPSEYTVNLNGPLTKLVRDQGACGSCWAAASATALEGLLQHDSMLMSQVSTGVQPPTVSSQAIVSCTPNPHNCGGTGGCDGATAELAFEMVKSRGIPMATTWPYQAYDGSDIACNTAAFNATKLAIKSYTVLPSNKLTPLKEALVSNGSPIVVSVDATNWNFYVSGIYDDMHLGGGDFLVNHAVNLMGYKEKNDSSLGYWLIKNSWGESFGENGYIRIGMKENEESHCGWDTNTHVGLACDGDPNRAWVCGTCGILYDSSFPMEPYIIQ